MLAVIQYKDPADAPKFELLDFRLKYLLNFAAAWAWAECSSPLIVVTDIDSQGVHRSASHREYRAVDLRIFPIGLERWERFADLVNHTFDFGQVSPKTGLPIVPVLVGKWDPAGKHDDHVHLQVPGPHRSNGRIDLNGVSGALEV